MLLFTFLAEKISRFAADKLLFPIFIIVNRIEIQYKEISFINLKCLKTDRRVR